jgi:hypothetical protein
VDPFGGQRGAVGGVWRRRRDSARGADAARYPGPRDGCGNFPASAQIMVVDWLGIAELPVVKR